MLSTDTTFTHFFRNQSSVMIIVDAESGRIIDANQAALDFYGYAHEVFTSMMIEGVTVRLDKELREVLMQDIVRQNLRGIQFVHKLADGQERHVQVDTSPVTLEGRSCVVCVIHDITQAFQSKEALRRGTDLFRALIEHSLSMVMLLDERGVVEFVSPAIYQVLGCTPDQVIGRHLEELVHRDDAQKMRKYWAGLIEQDRGEVQECQLRLSHDSHTSTWRTLSMRSSNMLGIENIQGVVMNSHDVTESQKLEASMRRYAKQLQETNRELEEFTYVASHDLQEPLRKIISFGSRLKEKAVNLSEQETSYIDRMTNAADRMGVLIRDLLSYTRLTTQESPVVETDLNRVVEGVLSDLEVAMREKHAHIEVERLPRIDADPTRMRQLFQNLVANAIKFSKDEESPEVFITHRVLPHAQMKSHNHTEECDWIEITVEDNGIGFEQKHAQSIFQPFSRLHGRNSYQGTGIGLAVCRKIVDQHNGKIFAFSAPGDGTTFQVLLPLRQAPHSKPSSFSVTCTAEERELLAKMLDELERPSAD